MSFVFQRTIEIVQVWNITASKVRILFSSCKLLIAMKPLMSMRWFNYPQEIQFDDLYWRVGPVIVRIAGRKQYVIIISSDMSDGETSQDLAPRLKLSSNRNTRLWLAHRITWSESWLLIGRGTERGVTTLTNWSYKTFDQRIPARSYVNCCSVWKLN